VLIGHYPNDQHASMERFDAAIHAQLKAFPGVIERWTPQVIFGRIKRSPNGLGKWLGYIDKFLLFPLMILYRIQFKLSKSSQVLFILPDHSHGIYMPLFCDKLHVIHVHDLIAIRTAKNAFYGQQLGRSGKLYQTLIARGLQKAKHFICVSEASKKDLFKYVAPDPISCAVVPNELNYPYRPDPALISLKDASGEKFETGDKPYLLHVGNGLWYKNRAGVLMIYRHLIQTLSKMSPIPALSIVGESESEEDRKIIMSVPEGAKVYFFSGLTNDELQSLYSQSIGLLFPSHHEGFGWPIIEALACGTQVLTTRREPMTEVGGDLADYIEPMPAKDETGALEKWLDDSVEIISGWLNSTPEKKEEFSKRATSYASQFAIGSAFAAYLKRYDAILSEEEWGTKIDKK